MRRTRGQTLEIDSELRNALVLYRVRAGVHRKPILPADAVKAVEETLGDALLPLDILSVFAATGRDLNEIATLTEEARDEHEAFAEYVVVGADEDEDTAAITTRWCVRVAKRAHGQTRPTGPTRVLAWPATRRKEPSETFSVAGFVTTHFCLGNPTPDEEVAISGMVPTFAPRMSAPKPRPRRQVWHPRFGRGIVVREVHERTCKIEIDFQTVGRKLILASYVQPSPPNSVPPLDAA